MSSAHDVAAALVELIDNRTLRAGQRLPPERQLCERFSSARNTVRRALEMLERERRVVRRGARSGFFVDAKPLAPVGARLVLDASQAGPSDILELRLWAEPAAAAMAAVRASNADLDEIERAGAAIARARTVAERESLDAAFHLALFRATRNPLMVSLCVSVNAVRDQHEWVENKRRILSSEQQCEFDREHLAIVEALRRRQPDDARAAMRAHIDSLRRRLLGDLLA
jgi:DNA-binding FadR family transcriptional regulator